MVCNHFLSPRWSTLPWAAGRKPILAWQILWCLWVGTPWSSGHHTRVSTWWAHHLTHSLLSLKDGSGVKDWSDSSSLTSDIPVPDRNSCTSGFSSGGYPKSLGSSAQDHSCQALPITRSWWGSLLYFSIPPRAGLFKGNPPFESDRAWWGSPPLCRIPSVICHWGDLLFLASWWAPPVAPGASSTSQMPVTAWSTLAAGPSMGDGSGPASKCGPPIGFLSPVPDGGHPKPSSRPPHVTPATCSENGHTCPAIWHEILPGQLSYRSWHQRDLA